MFWGHKMTESVIPDRTFDIKTSRGKLVYSLAQLICDFGTLTTLWSELIPGLFYSDLFDDPIWKSIAFGAPDLRGKSIFFESDKSSVLVGSFSFKWCASRLLTRSGYIRTYSVFFVAPKAHFRRVVLYDQLFHNFPVPKIICADFSFLEALEITKFEVGRDIWAHTALVETLNCKNLETVWQNSKR